MRALVCIASLATAFVIAACGSTSGPAPGNAGTDGNADGGGTSASTAGLHGACPAGGCASGQTCLSAPGPGGGTSTCEFRCASAADCPHALRCNLPPIAPDSLVNTCIE